MILNVLAVGDVVGEAGLDCLTRRLRSLKKAHDIHFTVVNGGEHLRCGYPAPAGRGHPGCRG